MGLGHGIYLGAAGIGMSFRKFSSTSLGRSTSIIPPKSMALITDGLRP